MGIFRRIADAVRDFFSSSADLTPADTSSGPPILGDGFSGTETTEVTGEFGSLPGSDQFPFDFALGGFLELGGDHKTEYVDLEGQDVDLAADVPWSDIDYMVVRYMTDDGTIHYTTIAGPFDDYDDFLDALADWWDEGS